MTYCHILIDEGLSYLYDGTSDMLYSLCLPLLGTFDPWIDIYRTELRNNPTNNGKSHSLKKRVIFICIYQQGCEKIHFYLFLPFFSLICLLLTMHFSHVHICQRSIFTPEFQCQAKGFKKTNNYVGNIFYS